MTILARNLLLIWASIIFSCAGYWVILKYDAHPLYHLLIFSIACSIARFVPLGISSFTFSIALFYAALEIAMAPLTIVIPKNLT